MKRKQPTTKRVNYALKPWADTFMKRLQNGLLRQTNLKFTEMDQEYDYIKKFLDYLDFQTDMSIELNNVDYSALAELSSKKLFSN